MHSSIWKSFCHALPLAMAITSSTVAWGQTTFTLDPKVTPVAAAEEETLFDTKLITAQSELINPKPSCTNSTATPSLADPGQQQMAPVPPNPVTPDNVFNPPPMSSLPAGQGALTAQNFVSSPAAAMAGGYLDPAAPMTQFRMRYDDGINNKFPDRGEYFYAKCGCFRSPALAGAAFDPQAKGPQGINASASYQDVRPYLEYALDRKLSIFTELPTRFVNFNSLPTPGGVTGQDPLGNTAGFSDMNIGFKYALIAEPDRYFTFQLRTYIPTGDSYLGLGTGHVSIEPSLLYYQRLTERLMLQGQLTEFTPIAVSSFASDVMQYGAGLSYIAYNNQRMAIVPTFEVVGWTFLNGQKFSPVDGGLQSAAGDTVFNVKPGVRVGFGPMSRAMMMQQHSIYAGFGIPVTDQQFYSNLFRLEYRYVF